MPSTPAAVCEGLRLLTRLSIQEHSKSGNTVRSEFMILATGQLTGDWPELYSPAMSDPSSSGSPELISANGLVRPS
jgi:hypothetical protein